METFLEFIALGDLFTDMLVFLQLYDSEHRAWTTITIFSMLAPFFACQVPFLVFLKELIYRDQKSTNKLIVLGIVMLSPLMLIYMVVMDFVFLILQAIFSPAVEIVKLVSFGWIDLSGILNRLDRIYEIMFCMQKLDVAGFRRMRTITQLSFETFI